MALVVVCAFSFLGACKKEEEHVHNYKSYVYKEATCSQLGVIEKLCLDCGDKKYEETSKSDTHDYVWTTIEQATCKKDGSKEGTCRDCGDKQTQIVLKGAHQYNWNTIKQATCKEDGAREGTCIFCQDKKSETMLKGEHQYVWQVINDATCFSQGFARGICPDCGEESTKDLPKTSHYYVNGICSMCFNTSIVAKLPQGEKLGYTLTDVTNIFQSFGYDTNISNINNEVIGIATKNGKLQLAYGVHDNKYNGEYYAVSFAVNDMLSDFVVEEKDDNVIGAIIIDTLSSIGQLKIIYNDGSIRDVGYIYECVAGYSYQSNEVVKSIAINNQNQFLAVYENDNVVLLGTVAEEIDDIAPNILYIQTGDTFSCCGFLEHNREQSEVIIAPSHMGKLVDSIENSAFKDNVYLEKVVFSDEIKIVGTSAFSNCENLSQIDLGKALERIYPQAFYNCALKEITIPVTCTEIGAYALYDCKNLTKIYYEGTIEQWEEITFGRNWNLNVPATEVICRGGNVTIK